MSKKQHNKKWQDYRSKKLQKSKYHKKYKHHNSSYLTNHTETSAPNDNFYININRYSKSVPTSFSFLDNPTETIDFFDDIVIEIQRKIFRNNFFIDSSKVQNVGVDALIYLIAIMQNIKINYEKQYTFRGNLPRDTYAAQIYQGCGFMSYVKSKIKKLPASTEKMQIISGSRNDPQVTSELCRFVMDKLNKERKSIIPLQKVLIELMSNVYHHAYNNDDIMNKKWYIYAEHINNYIHFIFVDTGASIAKTVRKNFIEKIQRMSKTTSSDGDLIFSTLQGDFRTETKEKHRGNGLSGVRELAETDLFENFTVISGRGKCSLSKENVLEKQDYPKRICGTIFIFDII